MHVTTLQALPWVFLPLPGHDRRCLKKEYKHDPEAVKAAEEVPEGALLYKTRLSDPILGARCSKKVLGQIQGPSQLGEAPLTPEVFVDVIVVAPGGMRSSAIPAGFDFGLDGLINGGDDAQQKGIFARDSRERRPTGGVVDVVLQDAVQVHGHVVKDVAEALGHKPEVSGLSPDEEVQRSVQKITARLIGCSPSAVVRVRNPDIRLTAKEAAPRRVVVEELAAKAPDDAWVERVDIVRRRMETHLRVGQEEDQMLPLVPDVVALEAEEGPEPVEEVHTIVPGDERGLT